MAGLALTRTQILGHRRVASGLDRRRPAGRRSWQRAAWAGLQDSMPRAALLSLHARVDDVGPDTLADSSFVQLWGPRFSVYVVAARDRAIFSMGRLTDDGRSRRVGTALADRLDALLQGGELPFGEAGRALGVTPNALRYAAPTGRVLLRWDGARQPVIRIVDPPDIEPARAHLELARRYLHVFGPSTPTAFAAWAGVSKRHGVDVFEALSKSLLPVGTPIGPAWILAGDEASFRAGSDAGGPPRLLPSGDTYYLLGGDDRALLVTDPGRRTDLWTSRVWPGAVLAGGRIVGTWRRTGGTLTVTTWRRLGRDTRRALEEEAAAFPLPVADRDVSVVWTS